jgi:predicted transcriptional regulator
MSQGSRGHALTSLQSQRVAAGLTVTRLAQKANVSDQLIYRLEDGGNCEVYEAQRLADALSVSLVTLGKKDC